MMETSHEFTGRSARACRRPANATCGVTLAWLNDNLLARLGLAAALGSGVLVGCLYGFTPFGPALGSFLTYMMPSAMPRFALENPVQRYSAGS